MAGRSASVLYVTGKGGVGKSFVAATLARAAVERGVATAFVELRDATNETAARPRGLPENAAHVVVDDGHALRHLLTKLLRLRFLSNRLMDSRTFASVAAAAPGVKDLVYLSYLRDLAAGDAGIDCDLVVVDGLASGHSVPLLGAPRRIHELVPVGPAARIAREADAFVRAAGRFRAVVVTLAEELCVTETARLTAALRELGVDVAPTIVNSIYPERVTAEQAAWLADSRASADATLHVGRRARQLELVDGLGDGAPLALPFLFEGHHLEEAVVERLFEAALEAAA